ncbi:MarR family transcriptional regulator [Pseudomonas sp. 1D4]|uniref:MarR family winged helix-turn-helix transcriptional regulator n=1 Tax=Pseudomonadaceae TaxID=135621 RepID=UPI00084A49C9|nr:MULTISPECIES: MarR family transcriptional regulator [Pseudomonas]OEC39914.1 MarR family transcriptional regulator [Pseudomonas sp. 1D4]
METTFSKHGLAYDRYTLVQLFKAIEEFRAVDPEMPSQSAALFLYSAIYPGCTMTDLQKSLGMTQASCSRNVSALSEWHRLEKPGLGLIVASPDPMERRRKIVQLTEKGQQLAVSLTEAVMNPVRLSSFSKAVR